ncbi:hypothetical protein [Massilia sp. AB1]|uniref:hypothetical protein n=1 Tax=Massilia sp. AB1 TaxID=2823371 RepID=UPI001B8C5E4F|nr:hypothetical protein [Massilia sp. AB1]
MSSQPKTEDSSTTSSPLTCGIIMPISSIDGLSAEHWSDVKSIIQEAVDSIAAPRFVARLVSEADDVGVIHKRIVQGVYSSDIVICDVSAKNSNVMFELGMRLAFDKPTIIIKDDKTDYSFDTSVIEHLSYPRDLRFAKINNFKKLLAEKVIATHKVASANPEHSTFLKNFGTFKVAHLNEKEATGEIVMIDMLTELQQAVSEIRRSQKVRARSASPTRERTSLTILVDAIEQLKAMEPNFNLDPIENLVSRLENRPDLTKGYITRGEFASAVGDACEIYQALH